MHLSWPGRSLALAAATLVLAAQPLPAKADSLAAEARARVGTVAEKVKAGAHELAMYALGLIGVAYRYGGEEPDSGLDCSGLVRHVVQQVAGITLPRTSKEMSRLGAKVARAELQPGDLVFFNTRRYAYSHVGIYLGDGRFVHAPRTGRDVEVARFDARYWQKRFDGARRLASLLPAPIPDAAAVTLAPAPPPVPVDLAPEPERS